MLSSLRPWARSGSRSAEAALSPAHPEWGTRGQLSEQQEAALGQVLEVARAVLLAHGETFPTDHLWAWLRGGGEGLGEEERLEDLCLMFLRARQFVVAKSIEMLMGVVKWRGTTRPWELTMEHAQHPSAQNTFFFTGEVTRHGMPFFYGMMRLMDRHLMVVDNFKKAITYMLEEALYRSSFRNGQIAVAFDFANWSFTKHVSPTAYKEMIHMLQDNYPERLGKVFLMNYPTTISSAYALVSPLMDKRTTSKLHWIAKKPSEAVQAEFEDPASAPIWLGGNSPFRLPGVDHDKEWQAYAL